MNRFDHDHDDQRIDAIAKRLLEVDQALEQQSSQILETPRNATDPTVVSGGSDAAQPAVEPADALAERCLKWIEAIRLTSPQMLRNAFQLDAGTESVPSQAAIPFRQSELEHYQTSIGRFQLIRKLGQGGYGVVFLAYDPTLHREVALKVPRPEVLVTQDLRRRFLREAEAAAALDHQHIVSVYEAGSAGFICYIAAAYCPGVSLSQWLNQRGQVMSPRLAAKIVAALADAVQHAHDRGVLHRDIKPGNVLVERAQDSSQEISVASVRLADFGLARVTNESWDESLSAAIVGTPAYMAPEQAANRRQDIGPATDIYGLGATLYHLLTGRPPIVGSSQLQTLSAILQVEPVEPSHYRSDIPRDLSAICLKCLEKETHRRYGSAADLQADLKRFLTGQHVVARPVGQLTRLSKWCRRNPVVATLSAISVSAVVMAMVVALAGWSSTAKALEREHLALMEADRAYEETKEAVDRYYVTVSENQLLNAPGMTPLRKQLLSSALEYYSQFVARHHNDLNALEELRRAYVRIADVHTRLGDSTAARAAYNKAMQQIDKQLAEKRDVLSALLQQATIHRKLAKLDRSASQLEAALEHVDHAIVSHRSLIEQRYQIAKNQDQLAQALSTKAGILQSMGQFSDAIALYEEGEQLLQPLVTATNSPEFLLRLAQLRGNRSIMLRKLNRVEESKPLLEASAEIYQELVNEFPEPTSYRENLGKAHANLSLYASGSKDFALAVQHLELATDLFDGLAEDHPRHILYHVLRASTRKEMGEILFQLGEVQPAARLLKETIRIFESVRDINPQTAPVDLAEARLALAILQMGSGRAAAAGLLIEQATQALEAQYEETPLDFHTCCSLATAYEYQARLKIIHYQLAEAADWLDRGLSVLQSLQQTLPSNPQIHERITANLACRAHAMMQSLAYPTRW